MRDFIGGVGLMLVIVAIALVVTGLVAAAFVGMGALFARFTELTLFEATVVTVPLGLATLYLLARVASLPVAGRRVEPDEWDESDDWDEWEDWADPRTFEDLIDADDFVALSPEQRRGAAQRFRQLADDIEALNARDETPVKPMPRHQRRRRR